MSSVGNNSETLVSAQIPVVPLQKTELYSSTVCTFVQMLPGIVTTVACLVGLVALNILHYHYLSIACAVGIAAGAYTIYQSYRVDLLKLTEQENLKLSASVASLSSQLVLLESSFEKVTSSRNHFETENAKLRETLVDFEKEKLNLETNVKNLKEETEKLKQGTVHLQNVNENLEKTAQTHVDQLSSLTASLQGVKKAVVSDHKAFKDNVSVFSREVAALEGIATHIDGSVNTFNCNVDQMQEFGKNLEAIFLEIEKWKNANAVIEQIKLLQQLNQHLGEVRIAAATGKAQAEAMQGKIDGLKIIEGGLRSTLDDLKNEISKMNHLIDQKKIVVDGIRMLVQEIKELPEGSALPPKLLELIKIL